MNGILKDIGSHEKHILKIKNLKNKIKIIIIFNFKIFI